MQYESMKRSCGLMTCVAAVGLIASSMTTPASGQWNGFGGPDRNFQAVSTGLADKWPEEGPKKLWSSELGDGYSSIAYDNGVLYTMYRKWEPKSEAAEGESARDGDDTATEQPGQLEYVAAIDASNGKKIWEHKYEAPPGENQTLAFGKGPNSTPLIVNGRVYTVGFTAKMCCLDQKSGKEIWSHDLHKDFGCKLPRFGYSVSPIAYKNMVITSVGGEGHGVVAFDQADGKVVWKAEDYDLADSSPILIDFNGQTQLVVLLSQVAVGLDPETGKRIWKHDMPNASNIPTPLWDKDGYLFCTSAYESGSRGIRLAAEEGSVKPEELWFTRKMRIQHGNAVRVGDWVYGSSGQDGPTFMSAINLKTGDVAWRKRGFAKATCLYADNKLIILDEEGKLALAKVTPEEFKVLSEKKISDERTWTVPTLVGTTLYVRDRKQVMAFDLS